MAGSATKLASPASSRAALATFGVRGSRAQMALWAGLVAVELALAAGVLAGSAPASWLAAALMGAFALLMLVAVLSGRSGAPCACFGSRSRVGWPAVGRNVVLAAAFAALPFLPDADPSTETWLVIGLVVALLACLGLTVAVLALAREVGMLRLRLGPAAALEIPDEGPALGSRLGLIERLPLEASTELGLAVFTSDGCRACRALEPAIDSLAAEPVVAVARFEESAEAAVWSELGIPGSPYAVAMHSDGTVLAKGTFNDLAQLESVLATAERRRAAGEIGASVG